MTIASRVTIKQETIMVKTTMKDLLLGLAIIEGLPSGALPTAAMFLTRDGAIGSSIDFETSVEVRFVRDLE